jgi:DNA-binding beta-propeller fold protein YncE
MSKNDRFALYTYIETIVNSGLNISRSKRMKFGAVYHSFKFPYSVCMDLEGNIIISDSANHCIRRLLRKQSFMVQTIAGDGTPGYADGELLYAKFNNPLGVCVDDYGNVIVADSCNNCIRRINLESGMVDTISGDRTAGYKDGEIKLAHFNYPRGVCMDLDGNVIVVDSFNNCIRRINMHLKTVETIAGDGKEGGFLDGPAFSAKFNYPRDICVDDVGDFYVTDSLSNRIRRIRMKDEVVDTFAGDGNEGTKDGSLLGSSFSNPLGICYDSIYNQFLVTQSTCVRIIKVNDGVVVSLTKAVEEGFKDGELKEAKLNYPFGLCLDVDGNIVIADTYNNRIRRIIKKRKQVGA